MTGVIGKVVFKSSTIAVDEGENEALDYSMERQELE